MSKKLEEKRLVQDIRRTLILGAYISEWGMPYERILSKKNSDVIEIYSFPPTGTGSVWRFASVGMSGIEKEPDVLNDFELLMAMSFENQDVGFQEIGSFMMDLFVHSLNVNVKFEPEKTIPETSLMPGGIIPKAVLLDEPRAESVRLEKFTVGKQEVKLLWAIPIYGAEQKLIVEQGIEAFDSIQENSPHSLTDIERPSFI